MNWFASLKKTLVKGMVTLSPSCREATRLQSDAMDRKLSVAQRFGLRMHLLLCKWCRRYGKQIQFLRNAVQSEEKEDHYLPQLKMSAETRERIKQKIQAGKEK